MKRILVTGSNGQLGSELKDIAPFYPDVEFLFTDLPELDISDDMAVESYISQRPVDALINCAAYTAVDKAESEPEKAYLINATAPSILAGVAERHDFTLVHISTDYVFNGKNYKPYLESDPVGAVSAYGISKLEGEVAVIKSKAHALIIRTSWMYSVYGHNFVKTILRLAKERHELKVVFDQIGSPTYAADLAKAILEILTKHKFRGCKIYHYSNEGICSWYDFASTIIQLANLNCRVLPITSSGFPTPAPRPHYSVLDKSMIRGDFDLVIPWWHDSLRQCLSMLR